MWALCSAAYSSPCVNSETAASYQAELGTHFAFLHVVFLSRKCNIACAPGGKASNAVTIVFSLTSTHMTPSLHLILSCFIPVALGSPSSLLCEGTNTFFQTVLFFFPSPTFSSPEMIAVWVEILFRKFDIDAFRIGNISMWDEFLLEILILKKLLFI